MASSRVPRIGSCLRSRHAHDSVHPMIRHLHRMRLPASLFLIAASLTWSGANASNESSIKDIQIEVHFTQCTDALVGDAHFCGEETWQFHIVSDGWRSEHSNLVRGIAGRWSATCSDGVYRAEIDGRIWPGTCRVRGDRDQLCFETHSMKSPGDLGGEQTQCFDVSGDTCAMDLKGSVWQTGAAGGVLNPYGVSSRDVTMCRVRNE